MRSLVTGGDGDLAQAIAAVLPGEVLTPGRAVLDVTDWDQVAMLIRRYQPDVVVNCAGHINPSPVVTSAPAEWVRQIQVNLTGTYLITHTALQHGATVIVNVGSAAGMIGRAGWSAYCAAKAGVISFTQSLAAEGVTAVCVSPHRTATKMRASLFPDEDPATLTPPEIVADVVRRAVAGEYPSGANVEVGEDGVVVHDHPNVH